MNKENIYTLAKEYLKSKDIEFAEPINLGRLNGSKQEVIFTDPLCLDPRVAVVVPGIIRVWVDLDTEIVTLIYDM